MIVQDPMVKGGIAAVVNGYYGSFLEKKYDVKYIQSYCDGTKLQKFIKAVKAYFLFVWNLVTNKPDILHMHTSFGASFYRKIPFIYMASICRIPIINHIHGPEFELFYEQASDKKKQLIKKIYNKCTYLITLSQEWKRNFLQVVPEEKIKVIENYSVVENELLDAERKKSQILFLGAINERKGCYDMPQIIQKVVKKVPNAIFVIAGDGELEHLKRLISEAGLTQNCVFPGWIRDDVKDAYLRQSSIFFLPSYNEGMPMAILDAMGYGLPVVSTNVGGIPQIVLDGQNGFVLRPGDIDDIAQALVKLLTDPSLRAGMGRKSVDIIRESYTLDKHFEKLFKLYESA